MKKLLLALATMAIGFVSTSSYAQCGTNTQLGTFCGTRSNFFFGEILPNAGCGTYTAQTNYSPGEYFRMPVLPGACYSVTTCGAPFDTQIMAFQGAQTINPFAYNDDNGPECTGTRASIIMTPAFNDYARVDVRQYNCQAGGSSSITVRVRQNNNLNITSSAADMCAGDTRALTATPTAVTPFTANAGNGGTFSGTGVSGTTFTAPTPAGAMQTYNITYTYGYCSTTQAIDVYNAPSTASAGTDIEFCGTTATLAATAPTIGTGTWVVVSGPGTVTTPSSPTSGVTGLVQGSTTVLEWQVTNGPCAANTDQVTLTGDATAPTAVCQNITVYLDGAGNASITAADIDGGSTDNCGTPTLSASQTSFTCANLGANTVTLTATDASSNTANCVATVTVADTTAPVAVCQNITVFLDGAGNATITAADIDNGSTDNCGTPTLSTSQTSFTCADIGANNVTLTATDGSGNTSNCIATVTVADTTAPAAACQNITVYLDGSGNATITAGDIDSGSSDNCGAPILSASQTAFTCTDIGANNVTLTATDGNGNTANCVATVTVADSTSPAVACQNITVYLDGAGNATITAADIDGGSTDNCSTPTLSASQTSFTCADLGANNVTLTATDGEGNTSNCVATVTVADTTSPVVACQNVTVYLDATGNATITAADIDGGSTDNCSTPTLSASQTSFTCADLGANNVTLTATDAASNASNCVAVVTVADTTSPVVACQNVTVYLDATGNASITAADIDGGSSDNCGTPTLSASQTAFTCAELGTNNVTLTATDGASNTANCVAVVTVMDTISPTITGCPGNINAVANATGCESIVTWTAPTESDNCAGVTMTSSHNSGDPFPVGTTTVTYSAVDGSGNTSNCSFDVVVTSDLVAMIDSSMNNMCAEDSLGWAYASVTGGDGTYSYDWDNDGFGDSDTTFIDSLGAGTYELAVMDGNGCVDTIDVTITSPDSLEVMIDSLMNPSVCGSADGAIYISVMGGTPGYMYDWDNDGTGDNDDTTDLVNIITGSYMITVTDTNGCMSSAMATLVDPNGPTVTLDSIMNLVCAEDTDGAIYVSISGGNGSYTIDWDNDGTGDNDDTTFIDNLIAGDYIISVEDSLGCTTVDTMTVTAPDTLVLSLTATDEMFGADGTIDLTVTGGTPGYIFDWDNDGTGDNDDTEDLSGLTAGNYVVVVTDTNGCAASASVDVGTQVGISSVDSDMTMLLYPNPNNGIFSIDFDHLNAEDLTIRIFDLSGKVVYFNSINGLGNNYTETIDISNVERGQYFIQVTNGETTQTIQLIKN